MKIPYFLWVGWRRFVVGIKCLVLHGETGILLHGFRDDQNPYWIEKDLRDIERYAKANPWVLRYSFHERTLERLKGRLPSVKII